MGSRHYGGAADGLGCRLAIPWGVAAAAVSAGAGIYDQNQAADAQKSAVAPLQNANTDLYSKAEQIASTPYTPYTGTQVAPITGSQQQAITAAQTNANNQVGQTDIGNATALAGGVAGNGWNANTASKYMNPYTQNVTAYAQKQLNQAYGNVQNAADLNAASSGAFGGDRAALTKANNAGEYELQSGTLAANNQANAYNSAIQAWQADNNRALGAAQSYQQSGNDITNMNAQQIKDLLATGGVAQATQQMQLNANYNNYLDQRGWAANQLQPLLSATSGRGTPAGVTPPNTASDLLGIGSALAGYYGSTYQDPSTQATNNMGGFAQQSTNALTGIGNYDPSLTSNVGNIFGD